MIINTSNTNLQILDSFDLGEYQSIEYDIQSYSNNYMSESKINIVHDGVDIFDTQQGSSLPPLQSHEFISSIDNYIGNISVYPRANNITFNIKSTKTSANLYGEHLRSGRLILDDSGFGIDLQSSPQNITIRSANNNQYVNSTTFISDNNIGPISLENNLLGANWESHNYNLLNVTEDGLLRATSSGQRDNFQFQEISTIPGKIYKISFEQFSEDLRFDVAKENSNFSRGSNFVRVGNSLSDFSLLNYQTKNEILVIENFFVATTDKTIVSFGYGERNSILTIRNFEVVESVPLYTYEQNIGTLYVQWNLLPNNSNIIKLGNIDIKIDESGMLRVNDNVIDNQESNNKLAISLGNMNYRFNNTENILNPINNIGVNVIEIGDILKISYSPYDKNLTQLAEYLNV